jgi:hypothetical protein
MTWNDYTVNPKVILGYYNNAPSLTGVEDHRIFLLRDGPDAEITFQPQHFPDKPSRKWLTESNTCQITIRASGITEFEMTNWTVRNIGDIAIVPIGGGMEVRFNGLMRFKIRCDCVDVSKVTGYVIEKNST